MIQFPQIYLKNKLIIGHKRVFLVHTTTITGVNRWVFDSCQILSYSLPYLNVKL